MLRILIFLIMQILFLVGRKLFIGKLKGYTNNIGNMPHLTFSKLKARVLQIISALCHTSLLALQAHWAMANTIGTLILLIMI